jgi:hypothetical protein
LDICVNFEVTDGTSKGGSGTHEFATDTNEDGSDTSEDGSGTSEDGSGTSEGGCGTRKLHLVRAKRSKERTSENDNPSHCLSYPTLSHQRASPKHTGNRACRKASGERINSSDSQSLPTSQSLQTSSGTKYHVREPSSTHHIEAFTHISLNPH